MTLGEADPAELPLPALYDIADGAAVRGQRRFMKATAARLWLGIAAAALAPFTGVWRIGRFEVLAIGVAGAFAGALCAEVWLAVARPQRAWFEGRTLAEGAKTLAWRYAVGAAPFSIEDLDARSSFEEELRALAEDQLHGDVEVPAFEHPSEAADALRASSLDARRAAFMTRRIGDQRAWYGAKAIGSATTADRWRIALMAGEVTGLCLALCKGLGVVGVDLSGLIATAVGCGAAWLSVKQHDSLARVYRYMHVQLVVMESRLAEAANEEEWSFSVAEAEDLICREHTMWRASRVTTKSKHSTSSTSYRDLDLASRRSAPGHRSEGDG